MHVGIVLYGGLDELSGGYRYDRRLVSFLRAQGDTVDVIALPWRTYPRHLVDSLSRQVRNRLDRPFDVLLQDELCHPSLWRHNPTLDQPSVIVSLVHLLRSGGRWKPAPEWNGGVAGLASRVAESLSSRVPPLPSRVASLSNRVVSLSNPVASLSTAVERRYLDSVDAVVCTSSHTEREVQSLLGSAGSLPSLVAYPGGRIGGPAISREEVRQRAAQDPFRVIFVGNLVPRKGVLDLLDALDGFDGEWEAALVGSHEADPDYARAVVRRAAQLRGTVTIHGTVGDRQLQRLLARADVLAVPSSYEGFGMVYLEAMEYGVVPLASAAGGAGEFVEDGTNGFLVEPGDVEGLTSRLRQLRDDHDLRFELADGALATAASHPDWLQSMGEVREFLVEQHERTTGQDTHTQRERE